MWGSKPFLPAPKKEALPKRITTNADGCPMASHRGDFETCPHCDAKYEMEVWYQRSTVLVLAAVMHKVSGVAVISECAKCFATSWVHQEFDRLHYQFPARWREAIKKEHARRNAAASAAFDASLCKRCSKLETGVDARSYSAWRHCPLGSGPCRTECPSFSEKPLTKAKRQ